MDSEKENEYRLPFGAFVEGEHTVFRLLAPKAESVSVVIFSSVKDQSGDEYPMLSSDNGVWMATIEGIGYGTLYGYRLEGSSSHFHQFFPDLIVCDPYARAVVTRNGVGQQAKSLILESNFNWEGDSWIKLNPRDAIIYEHHIRDMTNHPSSGAQNREAI